MASKNVIIYDGVETNEELPDLLRYIASQIESGMTSGYHPGWEIVDEDE